METHVYANDNEICSQAADGAANAAFPDVCHTPPPNQAGDGVPVPYPNTAHANSLANGSTTVFICGTPICLKDVSYLSSSEGDEGATEGVHKGIVSGSIKGRAYFVDWSPDVKVQGLNVCRHNDPMTQNHKS